MGSLTNKRIVLGITGGIAAYKSAELVRCLQRLGADVRVVMTPAATEFITPLTLQALSGHAVHLELLDTAAEAAMGHIQLARWADLILVAPASADFMARLTHGEAGDLLSAVCLASLGPVAIAPAMNQAMWAKPSTQDNIAALGDRGVHVFNPDDGYQACGDIGPGRMRDPGALAEDVCGIFTTGTLAGKKLVITAGPTREAIDPVRYISNHSSGKMGYALAQAAAEAGAQTVLISGPVSVAAPERVAVINVTSAAQMLDAVLEQIDGTDIFIACAAVADYRPVVVASQKIKKDADNLAIELTKNPDIVATIAARATKPFTVGFAAETENLEANAHSKLLGKGLDMVIANDVSNTAIGFNSDENQVLVVRRDETLALPAMSKSALATQLISLIAAHLLEQAQTGDVPR